MCPQCKEIFEIWGKGIKTPEDTKLLSHEVPQRFTKVFRYFDEDAQTMVQLMECKYCGTDLPCTALSGSFEEGG